MKGWVRFYTKYVVKKPIVFVVFVALGIFLLCYLVLNTKVAVIDTYEGNYAENRLIINEVVEYPFEEIYAYNRRSELVLKYNVERIEVIDNDYTVVFIDNLSYENQLQGVIKVDIPKEYVSLFSIIIGTENRYVEKEKR